MGRADDTVEIRKLDGTAVPLATKADVDALKTCIAALEGELETQRTWWPFDEDEVSRGWAVSPGEEEPSGFVAVFSDEAEAERYAAWRQEQERSVDDDERDPSWEYPNVLPAEFRVRIWNSFDPAPAPRTDAPADSALKDQAIAELSNDCERLRQRVVQLEAELRAAQSYSVEDFL